MSQPAVRESGSSFAVAGVAVPMISSAVAGSDPIACGARALFAGDRSRFEAQTEAWPCDVRDHARSLAADAFRKRNLIARHSRDDRV